MADTQFKVEDPVSMCRTDEVQFWTHGWVNKGKFKGSILHNAEEYGGYDARDVFVGKVHHGWIISVAGDVSGCGWDTTMYFEKEEPKVIDDGDGDRTWDGATIYEQECRVHKLMWHEHDWDVHKEEDCSDEEQDVQVVDGPHKATWWESAGEPNAARDYQSEQLKGRDDV